MASSSNNNFYSEKVTWSKSNQKKPRPGIFDQCKKNQQCTIGLKVAEQFSQEEIRYF